MSDSPIQSDQIVVGESGTKLDVQLTPYIDGLLTTNGIAGLALAVVHEGNVVYARGFGVQDMNTSKAVTPNTVFHLASISKPFVATAIMQLVERGLINLSDPVQKHLPYFAMKGEEYRSITIQQMLSHVAGMPNSNDYEWNNPQYDEGALERYVRDLSSEELIAAPGERFRYSNVAFEVLGDLVAKVSKQSFEDYQQDQIFDPVEMSSSTFLMETDLPSHWAAPHSSGLSRFQLPIYPYNRRHAPSSTLHSNVLDMANWAIANLNRGGFDSKEILESSSYDVLWKEWAVLEDADQEESHVGLSWFLGDHRGEKTIGHGGSDDGFHANLLLVPERSIGVIVLSNSLPAPVTEISKAAIDVLLGEDLVEPKALASLEAWKDFEKGGMEAVVSKWNQLKEKNLDEYDFGVQQFLGLYFAIKAERAIDSSNIASFANRVLSNEEIEYLKGIVDYAMSGNPNNAVAKQVKEIFG